MFHKLHYYDDFYLDDHFWDSVAGKARIRKRGLTKAVGEMPFYGQWCYDKELFLHDYDWCRSHGIVSSFRLDAIYKMCGVFERVYTHWRSDVYLCEDDARCKVVEEQGNPFDRLVKRVICHKDSDGNHYARFFLNETDAECDGYAIEVATLFDFAMEKDEFGSKTTYTFKCVNRK